MKLYTEFEVKFAIDIARCQPDKTFDEVLEKLLVVAELTPIELPSDEEIEEYVDSEGYWGGWSPQYFEGIIEGAKWMRDKIKGGNKLKNHNPIEIPSDEEIHEMGKDVIIYNDTKRGWFIEGLKFMRDKIKGGNK
jgi:hypothetical protein